MPTPKAPTRDASPGRAPEPGRRPATARTTMAEPAGARVLSAPARALRKLGLVRDIDLALHLPLRYEDETQLTPSPRCATATSRRWKAW